MCRFRKSPDNADLPRLRISHALFARAVGKVRLNSEMISELPYRHVVFEYFNCRNCYTQFRAAVDLQATACGYTAAGLKITNNTER